MAKILLVEDEINIASFIERGLQEFGHEVCVANDGQAGWELVQQEDFQLLILDIIMPKMNGLQLCKQYRQTYGYQSPVIMLTALGTTDDIVNGLDAGADDYLPKPFLPKELLLRVGAILHRTYPEPHRTVELAASTVDLEKAEVWKNGERLPLTAKELQLFQKLYENAGRIVTTGILCETICGEFWQGYESTLSTHIRHLREKIEETPSKPVSLVTAKGLGYRLNLKGAKS